MTQDFTLRTVDHRTADIQRRIFRRALLPLEAANDRPDTERAARLRDGLLVKTNTSDISLLLAANALTKKESSERHVVEHRSLFLL